MSDRAKITYKLRGTCGCNMRDLRAAVADIERRFPDGVPTIPESSGVKPSLAEAVKEGRRREAEKAKKT